MEIEKISFKELGYDDVFGMLETLPEDEKRLAREIVESFDGEDFEIPCAFSVTDGVMLVRAYFKGFFYFMYPIPISENANLSAAIDKTLRYAMLESIIPQFEGVTEEGLEVFRSIGCRHLNIEKSQFDEDGETYSVIVQNEKMLSLFLPQGEFEDITLYPLVDEDTADYARLCRDTENNKYWGYDCREDFEPDAPDSVFIENAKRDYRAQSAVALSIKKGKTFLGEALVSCFDFKGGADISIRIIRSRQGKGYAKKALEALLEICRKMELGTVYARVFNENLPSMSLFSKRADSKKEKDGITVFTFKLYED